MPDGGRSCHRSCHYSSIHSSIHYMVFAWFFHAFEAACLVMSGIGVGLASSFFFLWASEGDVRQFFGGWFLDRLGLNPAGVGLFRLRAERRPELPPKLPLQLHPQLHPLHGFCIVFSCFVRHKPVELHKDSQKVQACGLTFTVVPGPARELNAQQMKFSKSSSFGTLLLCIEFGIPTLKRKRVPESCALASAEPSGKLRRSMTSRQSTRI